jgi:2'-5' RNA ligase
MSYVRPNPGQARPLVVTLEIDDVAQARFDAERLALFPPGRTAVGAHVTLFHALPGAHEPDAVRELAAAAAAREPFPVEVPELMSLGRGVAYRLHSAELLRLHRELQVHWWEGLSAQDRQGYRPHVTVQNKVSPEVAAGTLAQLRQRFTPFSITARAVRLWRYDGGPWTFLQGWKLGSSPP